MEVIERVPFGNVPHAFELRFNHLVDPTTKETYLQFIYKFGTDEAHFEEYEVLIRTFKVGDKQIVDALQA